MGFCWFINSLWSILILTLFASCSLSPRYLSSNLWNLCSVFMIFLLAEYWPASWIHCVLWITDGDIVEGSSSCRPGKIPVHCPWTMQKIACQLPASRWIITRQYSSKWPRKYLFALHFVVWTLYSDESFKKGKYQC